MQKNTTLIPIIAGYKLSDNDLAAQIKNQPHISQLKQKMEQILQLYMEQLKKQQEKKEEYVVKKAQEYMEKHCSCLLYTSGISLLELISKNQIPSVVIMLSGYDDYTYIRNALRLGAYDYLLKPVNIQNFVSMLRLLIPRLKDSSVKLQAEEVSCVRPETQGDYFDLPAKEPYYTKEDLGKELEHLSAGLLSMDEEGTKDKIQGIFSHLSQEAMAKEQFKQVFSAFLYTCLLYTSQPAGGSSHKTG